MSKTTTLEVRHSLLEEAITISLLLILPKISYGSEDIVRNVTSPIVVKSIVLVTEEGLQDVVIGVGIARNAEILDTPCILNKKDCIFTSGTHVLSFVVEVAYLDYTVFKHLVVANDSIKKVYKEV